MASDSIFDTERHFDTMLAVRGFKERSLCWVCSFEVNLYGKGKTTSQPNKQNKTKRKKTKQTKKKNNNKKQQHFLVFYSE